MKKWLLLVASMAMNASVFAQWTLPVPSSTVDMPMDAESAAYLYNLEAGGFLGGANDWGTRASITAGGEKLYLEESDGGLYFLRCYPTSKGAWKYVSANDDKQLWIDGDPDNTGTYQGCGNWQFEKHDGYYTFTNQNVGTMYNGGNLALVDVVNGGYGNSRLWFYGEDVLDGDGNPMFGGKAYDKWVFVTEEVRDEIMPFVEPYRASVKLEAAIKNAKELDPKHDFSRFDAVYMAKATVEEMDEATANVNAFIALYNEIYDKTIDYVDFCDFSGVQAVYDNPNSTTEELEAAKKEIKVIIDKYEATKATFDNPLEANIGDGSSLNGWTREFTGTGTTGDPATNTWSSEANDGADGTDMVTPFCQIWTGRGGILSDQKIYNEYYAAPGLYKLTIDLRAYNEAGGIDTFKGLSMFFGNDTIDVQSQVEAYQSNGKSVLWKEDYFTLYSVVNQAGPVQFGFDIKDANFNWIAFKNTSLTYYGKDDNDVESMLSLFDFSPSEAEACQELLDAYNNKVTALSKAKTFSEFSSLLAEVNQAKMALDANAAAYEELLGKLNRLKTNRYEKSDLGGDYWDAFCDFFDSDEEVEGYPTPTACSILDGDRSLKTEEIAEYIKTVEEKYEFALKNSLKEGTDCSDMLSNASFADGFNGWNGKNINDGGKVYKAGGYGMNNVEVYQNSVDCSQTIDNIPNGIYALTCRAYERRGDGAPANVFLFLNQFQTPVQHIKDDALNQENAENKINCFDTLDDGGTGYPADSRYTDGEGVTWLYPNSQEGASYAFAAGRYEQTVYGLVEDGKLNIGLTSNGNNVDWTLWADFKLTYMAKNETAVTSVFVNFTDQLITYKDENYESLSVPVFNEVTKVCSEASDAVTKDADTKFRMISKIVETLAMAKENVEAYNNALSIMDKLWDTMIEYEDDPSIPQSVWDAYNAWDAKRNDILDMTTEELIAYAKQGRKINGMIVSAPRMVDIDFAAATADKPVEATAAIVNPSFEIDGMGTLDGWTYVQGQDTKAAENSNDTYHINFPEGCEEAGDYVFNTWSGSIPAGGLPISQDIYGLPAGTYELSAVLASDANNVITLSANETSENFTTEVDKKNGLLGKVRFVLTDEDECLTIKVNSKSWYKADYFRLFYFGNSIDPTTIKNVDAETAATSGAVNAIYNAAGVRVAKFAKGINIVKMADGKVRKVVIK